MRFLCFGLALLIRVNAVELTRDYLAAGKLNPVEEGIVLQIAKNKGITSVAAIRTYYIQPSSYIGIQVVEEEKRLGTKVKYRFLNLSKNGWSPSEEGTKAPEDRLGDFTVDYLSEMDFDVFIIGAKEYRISLQGGISRTDAEPILKLLLAGKVKFQTKKKWDYLRGFDLHKPYSISLREAPKSFSAGFTTSDAFLFLEFKVEDDTLLVSDISLVIS
jgi:hypothetical protein